MNQKLSVASRVMLQAAMLPAMATVYADDGLRQMRAMALYRSKHHVEVDINYRASLQAKFEKLALRWQDETWFMSNAASIARHPAYQEIIRLGNPVVPLILKAMQREPDHWFWALHEIVKVNPVEEKHAGDVEAMTRDWLKWGRDNQYI